MESQIDQMNYDSEIERMYHPENFLSNPEE